jgi:hypothetical protein
VERKGIMAQSKFISIEVENGVVKKVEGNPNPDKGPFGSIFSGVPELYGQRANDALNACADLGYEFMATETVGKKTIYRLTLSSR